tara:strand:+ start:400 stop:732 length:333 start_codon:yes stop_codon:yes gene_type:complete
MARWENEDVSDLNLPDPEQVKRVYIGKSAATVEEKNAFAYTALAGDSKSYYILCDRAEIIDPYNDRFTKSSSLTRKFKKVSKGCFDFYTKYLKTKNNLYFTRSRRLAMEN